MFHVFRRYIHGARVIFPPMPESLASPNLCMLMMDFNVTPRRIDDPVDEYPVPDACEYHVVDKERTVAPGSVFESPVVSRLPYSLSTRSGDEGVLEEYTGYMMDEERLIGMRVSGFLAVN